MLSSTQVCSWHQGLLCVVCPLLQVYRECCSHHRLRQGKNSTVLGSPCALLVKSPSHPLNRGPLSFSHLFILRVGHTGCNIWMTTRGQVARVSYFFLPREPRESNSRQPAWQQVTLHTGPPPHPSSQFLKCACHQVNKGQVNTKKRLHLKLCP